MIFLIDSSQQICKKMDENLLTVIETTPSNPYSSKTAELTFLDYNFLKSRIDQQNK